MTPQEARDAIEDYLLYGNFSETEKGKAQSNLVGGMRSQGTEVTGDDEGITIKCGTYGGSFIKDALQKCGIDATVAGPHATHVLISFAPETMEKIAKLNQEVQPQKEKIVSEKMQHAFDGLVEVLKLKHVRPSKEQADKFFAELDRLEKELGEHWGHAMPHPVEKAVDVLEHALHDHDLSEEQVGVLRQRLHDLSEEELTPSMPLNAQAQQQQPQPDNWMARIDQAKSQQNQLQLGRGGPSKKSNEN